MLHISYVLYPIGGTVTLYRRVACKGVVRRGFADGHVGRRSGREEQGHETNDVVVP